MSTAAPSIAHAAVMRAVMRIYGATADEIAAHAQMSRESVDAVCASLIEAGVLRTERKRFYKVIPFAPAKACPDCERTRTCGNPSNCHYD